MLDLPIVYEDDDLVVICKPVGVVVNRAKTVKGETVEDWMRARMGWPEAVSYTHLTLPTKA